MQSLSSYFIFLSIVLVVARFSQAQNAVAITVTNSDLGLIKETRLLELEEGVQLFNLEDIPSQIDPTSVLIESKGNSFNVFEQNYEYDLIDVDKVLTKSIDQEITIIHPDQGTISGRLLSASSENIILLDHQDNLQIIPRNAEQKIYLKDYTKKKSTFITKPTLMWKIKSEKAGQFESQISYLSRGLDWEADYVGRLNENDTEIAIACWVTIHNRSGKSFQKARLKLMAGDLNVLQKRAKSAAIREEVMLAMAEEAFEEKPFFEYHLYTLQRTTDLNNNQVKQIQLFPETKSPTTKTYRVDSYSETEVKVFVSIQNSKEQNLGFPLPAGTIRIYKSDGQDLEFVGENEIKHTAKDEKLDIEVGKAFDIVAERKIISTQRPTKRSQQQIIEYSIRNHKKENIEVEVVERLGSYQQNELISSNFKPLEKRADYFKFKVPVKSTEETILTFEYRTTW